MNAVSSVHASASGYVEIVEGPFACEIVQRMRNVDAEDQSRVLAVVKALATGQVSAAEVNAAAAAGYGAACELADRLAA